MEKLKTYIINELEEIKKNQIITNDRLLVLCEDVGNLPDDEVESIFNMKVGQIYWYIDDVGNPIRTNWHDVPIDRHRLSIGNIYLTENSCEFAVGKLKVIQEIAKWQFEFDPFMVDWEDTSQYKSFFFYSHKYDRIEYNSCIQMQNNDWLYFSSSKKSHQCIESIGTERIKKYLFKVGV